MSCVEALRAALEALRAHMLRSFLTLLGIVIGVAAVITVASIGMGVRAHIDAQMEALGSNVLLVTPNAQRRGALRVSAGRVRLDERDAQALKSGIRDVVTAAPALSASAQAVSGNRNWPTTVHGIDADYLPTRQWPIAAGRGFRAEELQYGAKVALLGSSVARRLFGEEDTSGRTVRIGRTSWTVVGVLAPKGASIGSEDQNDLVLVPLHAARTRLVGRDRAAAGAVDFILVSVLDATRTAAVKDQMLAVLRQRHRQGGNDAFRVLEMTEFLETRAEAARILQSLLIVVASVSLLVGGIGIMNIMLVSVVERTREIGVRRAMGAQYGDILRQFLVEAATLSTLGGAAGIAAGMGASAALSSWAAVPSSFDPLVVVLAALASAAIGILFGYYPARRAAQCTPIEALRQE